jgi:hypothetical protein
MLGDAQEKEAGKGAPVLDEAQTATLVAAIRTELGSSIGSTVLSRPFARGAPRGAAGLGASARGAADAGQHENGGVWPSQNHPLVLALAGHNATLALEEWARNARATQARHFPHYWPGIWSAADVATSHLSTDRMAGTQAWPAMPV